MSKFYNKVISEVNNLRINKGGHLNIVQIGTYDGVEMDDICNLCADYDDNITFIEPNYLIFNQLINEKKKYNKANFLDVAVIPNKNFYHEDFYIHKTGGGSTFVKALINPDLENNNYIIKKVKVITVEELLKFIDHRCDVFFIDVEGYDHDIVKNILNYIKPDILYFESWNMVDVNNKLNKDYFTTRNEIIDILNKNGYYTEFNNSNGENIFAIKI